MDVQLIVDIATGVLSFAFGWLLKVIWSAITDLKDDMKDLNSALHKEYVRKDDYHIEMAKIETMFQRIMDKLDAKADKL